MAYKSKRSCRYPCSSCHQSCHTDVIECSECKRWTHRLCVPMSEELFSEWSQEDVHFICKSCAFTSDGDYDFDGACRRLVAVSTQEAAKSEELLLKTYRILLPMRSEPSKSADADPVSTQILKIFQPIMLQTHRPLEVGTDGNCFYRALSLGLYGTQEHHKHLRLLTALEILSYRDHYDTECVGYKGDLDITLTEPYADEVRAACNPGSWSGMTQIYAASAALQIALRSYCPPVLNEHFLSTPLTRKVAGRGVSSSALPQAIMMWTNTKVPHTMPEFSPNHFSLLLEIHTEESPIIDVDISSEQESDLDQECTLNSSDIPEEENLDTLSCGKKLTGGKFVTEAEALEILHSAEDILTCIPDGKKENIMFKINNEKNLERRAAGLSSKFIDDCGAWGGTHSPTTFKAKVDSKWITVFKKDGLFSVYRQTNKKRHAIPLEPQPSQVLQLHRYYTTSKRNPEYKRRVTWIEDKQPAVALVEYIGTYPGPNSVHGNAKFTVNPYCRTSDYVMDCISAERDTKPRELYEKLVREADSENKRPANLKQIANKKCYERKKGSSSTSGPSNMAKDFINLHNSIHEHPFIRSINHSKSKSPCVMLYTDEQIADITRFCCASPNSSTTVLGVDKTYNLGHLHVTSLTYKHLGLIRTKTQDHPIFLGPILIHGQSDWKTFGNFFNSIAMEIPLKNPNLVIGSDEEKAIKKGSNFGFGKNTDHISCNRHIKNNAVNYLKDKTGVNEKERNKIISAIFGQNGLIYSDNQVIFEERNQTVLRYIENLPQFENHYLENILPLLQENFKTKERHQDVPIAWTNNNCESVNHIIKMKVNWKPQDTMTLVNSLYEIVKGQYLDMERAFIGRGEFRLDSYFQRFSVDRGAWASKSAETRKKHTQRFLNMPKGKRNMVTACGLNLIGGTCNGKKPNQRKRKRADRTVTLPRESTCSKNIM